ncbi:MAG: hypothetical protein QNJ34_20550 [Xenococcaceae cyanobacterium MO_188.B29]|nr:hypothetical protein [Xenococcaceae cyanobacterium MO_188.B29]
MKDASNFGLGVSKLQSDMQLKKEIEELEKERTNIKNLINKKSKSVSFYFPNNNLPSNNESLAERDVLLYKIWDSLLENKINKRQEELTKRSESKRKEHQKEWDKWIEQRKIRPEEPVVTEPIYPRLTPINRNLKIENPLFPQYLSGEKIPSPEGNTSIYKPPTRVSNSNFFTNLFWLVVLLLVISFLFRQGTNEKQEKNKQGYLQKNVPVVLDIQAA